MLGYIYYVIYRVGMKTHKRDYWAKRNAAAGVGVMFSFPLLLVGYFEKNYVVTIPKVLSGNPLLLVAVITSVSVFYFSYKSRGDDIITSHIKKPSWIKWTVLITIILYFISLAVLIWNTANWTVLQYNDNEYEVSNVKMHKGYGILHNWGQIIVLHENEEDITHRRHSNEKADVFVIENFVEGEIVAAHYWKGDSLLHDFYLDGKYENLLKREVVSGVVLTKGYPKISGTVYYFNGDLEVDSTVTKQNEYYGF
jgi:hypothetical protein